MKLTHSVYAGKYDGGEENCKYADSFDTMEEAFEALANNAQGYPWAYIETRVGDYIYLTDVTRAVYRPVKKEAA